jgi:hypothetical protein
MDGWVVADRPWLRCKAALAVLHSSLGCAADLTLVPGPVLPGWLGMRSVVVASSGNPLADPWLDAEAAAAARSVPAPVAPAPSSIAPVPAAPAPAAPAPAPPVAAAPVAPGRVAAATARANRSDLKARSPIAKATPPKKGTPTPQASPTAKASPAAKATPAAKASATPKASKPPQATQATAEPSTRSRRVDAPA